MTVQFLATFVVFASVCCSHCHCHDGHGTSLVLVIILFVALHCVAYILFVVDCWLVGVKFVGYYN